MKQIIEKIEKAKYPHQKLDALEYLVRKREQLFRKAGAKP